MEFPIATQIPNDIFSTLWIEADGNREVYTVYRDGLNGIEKYALNLNKLITKKLNIKPKEMFERVLDVRLVVYEGDETVYALVILED